MSTIKNKNEIEYFKKGKRNRVGEHMSLYGNKEGGKRLQVGDIKECSVTIKSFYNKST